VRTPDPAAFAARLREAGATYEPLAPDGIEVHGLAIERVGELAARAGVVLHELSPQNSSLEDAFLQATAAAQEYRSGPEPPAGVGAP